MSMYKEIIYKDKKYCFKCSAGTDILFKRMFKTDLDVVYKAAVMGIDPNMNIKELMDTVSEIKNGDPKDPERIQKGLNFMKEHMDFLDTTAKLVEFVKEFAFITYLEANNDPKEVAKHLNTEEYVMWLMELDEGFFRSNTTEFQNFYNDNIHQSSVIKN